MLHVGMSRTEKHFFLKLALIVVLQGAHTIALAAPGDTIYFEDFQDDDTGGWTAATGTLGTGEFPAGSGEISLFTCCGTVDAFSPLLDTSVPGAILSLRIQRGGASIDSDVPEGNREYLDLYFLNDLGNWVWQGRYPADGASPGEMINDSFTLDAQFLHEDFRIRLFQDSGDAGEDYWHLHEIHVFEAGPNGGIGSLCDDFSQGLSNWTVNSFGGDASPTTQTADSPVHSLAIFNGGVRVISLPVDLSDADAATLNLWVRRGSNAFSDAPNGSQDLAISYLDAGGNQQILQSLPGGGQPGEIFNLSYSLPAAALHDAFRIRFDRYGSGAGGYWHVDDVCIDVARPFDHFAITHDGNGVNCQAEPVRLTAHDANHFVVENHAGTASLSTSSGNGDWSLFDGNGTLNNVGNGAGNYSFVTSDNGTVLLGLRDTYIETVNIDAAQGGLVEDINEDDALSFAATGFNFTVNGVPATIGTQVAAKPSNVAPDAVNIALQAIRTSDETGACEAAFQGNENVDLAFTCENPGSCAGRNVLVNGTAIAANSAGVPSAFTALALDFGDETQASAPIVIAYDDAGRIRLHARKLLSPSGEVMSGSSNDFVVRPFGFDILADEGSITAINPGATAPGDAAFERAGEPFRVTVSAVGWQAADDSDADGIPDGHDDTDASNNANLADNIVLPNFALDSMADSVSLSTTLVAPAGGNNPGLAGTTSITAFTAGSGAVNDIRWYDVGIIELHAGLGDNDYMGTGPVPGRSGHVGRFVPHHLSTATVSHGCSDTYGFTYSRQPLQRFTVSAHAEDDAVTQNFSWDLAGGTGFATDITLSDAASSSPGTFNTGVSRMDFVSGNAVVNDVVSFAFNAEPQAPYSLRIRASDADVADSRDYTEGVTEIRSGRFVVADTRAFLFMDATSKIAVESFDDNEWDIESQDECTVLDVGNLSLENHAGDLAPGDSTIDTGQTAFTNGSGSVTMTAPGTGNAGSMELHHDVEPWLEFDWEGDGVRDPFGTIHFHGIFESEPGFIYRREIIR